MLHERTQVKVRLHGIDAPEAGQDFGSRAKALTSELAFGKVVNVRPRDRNCRAVADVRTLVYPSPQKGDASTPKRLAFTSTPRSGTSHA